MGKHNICIYVDNRGLDSMLFKFVTKLCINYCNSCSNPIIETVSWRGRFVLFYQKVKYIHSTYTLVHIIPVAFQFSDRFKRGTGGSVVYIILVKIMSKLSQRICKKSLIE